MINRVWLLAALLTTIAAAWAPAGTGVDLASMQGWDIVVAADALPSEVYAAERFQSLFVRASGIKLPIVKTTNRPDRHVFIGVGKAMRTSAVGFDVSEFGPGDLRIVVRGNSIAIAGGRPRGTLYGVYAFLENTLGVRFLTYDQTHVPKITSPHNLAPVDYFYHPPLIFRFCSYVENRSNQEFAVKLRNNNTGSSIDARLGGNTGLRLINHSFAAQIPSAKYGEEHPEFYCEIDGKRLAKVKNDSYDNQPCLTNPDVLRIVTANVLKQLADHPGMENISVSQNDNNKHCRCVKCLAIDEREGTPMGSLLTFVNAVADEVAARDPGVMVGTLSYRYSRKPPETIRPRPNVQIQLCSIEACLMHAINDPTCPKNVEFCRDMNEWGKICDNIFVWNYNVNFGGYQLPCPNLRVIEPNIRYFVANNARGIFMQAAGGTLAGEFSDLRNYMISNLLWDPTRSGEQLMNEFLDLHYGRSAKPIRRFISLVHDRAEASGLHQGCFGRAKDYGLDESVARAGLEAFDEAMELAEGEAVRLRVEKASMIAYRAAIEPVWDLKEGAELDPGRAKQLRPLVRRFFELCRKYNVTRVAHDPTLESAHQRLKRIFGLQDTEEL